MVVALLALRLLVDDQLVEQNPGLNRLGPEPGVLFTLDLYKFKKAYSKSAERQRVEGAKIL